MGEYVDLPGVKTWYEVEGEGDPLVLLHGGLCPNETWAPQRPDLASRFRIFLPERRAHGHTPDVEGPLSYRDMAADTIDFITSVVGEPAHLLGWSDGGIVALIVAIERPDLVHKLVAVSANFLPAAEAGGTAEMLDEMTPENPGIAMFRSMYEASSPDGPEHWPSVIAKYVAMLRTEPTLTPDDLGRIQAPTLVVASDDDFMSLEHTAELYRSIPNAQLAVVPGTSHGLLMEKPELVNGMIVDFLATDPVPTMVPILRGGSNPSA